jgi:biopolymer transport protein ExbD
MSHGGSDVEVAEPNLTPLLDLVLQMVMFFMIVANFVSEQLNQSIQLPDATTAVPIDREVQNIIVLNVDADGNLLERSKEGAADEKLDSQLKIQRWMNDTFAHYKDSRNEKEAKEMTVVVRGHKDSSFEHIYRVMRAAKEAGFVNVQLRANRPQEAK